MTPPYTKVLNSFHQGPAGSGWSLSILDDDDNGIGVNVHYHKLSTPNRTLYEEELRVSDLIRLKQFCETAINALMSRENEKLKSLVESK